MEATNPRAGDHSPLSFLHTRAVWAALSPTVSTVQVGDSAFLHPLIQKIKNKEKVPVRATSLLKKVDFLVDPPENT